MKVCDAYKGIVTELVGIQDSCPNIYHLIKDK